MIHQGNSIRKSLLFKKLYYYTATLLGALCIHRSSLFDRAYYLQHNPDVKDSGVNAFRHYLFHGGKEGRNPGPDFHSSFYMSQYPDVKDSALNPLAHYFLFGKKLGRKCKPHQNHLRISFRQYNITGFKKPVLIIVPVFIKDETTFRIFQDLTDSLKKSYATPQKNLSFLFIDDFSAFRDARAFFKSEIFFTRKDVQVLYNQRNKGFVSTINIGFAHAAGDSDVVILNSDTLVFANTFEVLQDVAYRQTRVASVTPLSNRATIASLSNWPEGEAQVNGFEHELVAKKIADLKLLSPPLSLPTGHGFCMYMTRQALDETGVFDEQTFGRGYGEENDWCQRARKQGMKNLLSTETWVFHHDASSFLPQEKKYLISKNLKTLATLYPDYHREIQSFIREDPLQVFRAIVALKLTEINKEKHHFSSFAFFLHTDPYSYKGGTEVHVMDVVTALLKHSKKVEVFIFYPKSSESVNTVSVRYLSTSEDQNFETWFVNPQFVSLLPYFAQRIDYIHIHHFLGWNQAILNWLQNVEPKLKVLTLHDFKAFCTNPNLIFTDGKFCPHRGNISQCHRCFGKTRGENRERNLRFLMAMDKIIVPSPSAKEVIKGLAETKKLMHKIHVFPHFLPFVQYPVKSEKENEKTAKLLVFLGGAADVKGINEFLAAKPVLEKSGFRCEIWGYGSNFTKHQKTYPYKGYSGLMQRRPKPAIVLLPSVWPETFSYTLFEALFLFHAPVVVSPYGNPADFVSENQVGVVLQNIGAKALIEGVNRVWEKYDFYKNNVSETVAAKAQDFTSERYIKKYIHFFGDQKRPLSNLTKKQTAPKKLLYLHIGMPKTGSSAIQAFAALNAEQLNAQGVYYPDAPPFEQAYLTGGGNAAFLNNLMLNNESDKIRQNLNDWLHATEKILLLSNEGLFHLLRINPKKFFRYFSGYDLRIICYVRRQDKLFASVYNQVVKNHDATFPNMPHIEEKHDFAHTLFEAKNFISVENIIVRPYEQGQFENHNIYDDFCRVIGLERNESFVLPEPIVNPSLNMQALEYRRLLNHLKLDFGNFSQKIPFNQVLADFTVASGHGKPFQRPNIFPPGQGREILNRYEQSNEAVAKMFSVNPEGILFKEPPDNDTDEYLRKLTPEEAKTLTQYFWDKRNDLALKIYKQIKIHEYDKHFLEAVEILMPAFLAVLPKKRQLAIDNKVVFDNRHEADPQIENGSVEYNPPVTNHGRIKKVFLHIGLNKTATSSIQETLRHAREILEQEGILYPDFSTICNRYTDHNIPFRNHLKKHPERLHFNQMFGLNNPHNLKNVQSEFVYDFKEQVANFRGHSLVLSAESFIILNISEIEKLKNLIFEATGKPIEINVILFLRHPVTYAQSNMQQGVKMGFDTILTKTVKTIQDSAQTFQNVLKKYAAMFGRSAIQVVRFEDAIEHPFGPAGMFLSMVGLPDNKLHLVKPIKANESISTEAVHILSAINRAYPLVVDGRMNPEREMFKLLPIIRLPGQKFRFSDEDRRKVWENSENDRRWVEQHYGITPYRFEEAAGAPEPKLWCHESLNQLEQLIPEFPAALQEIVLSVLQNDLKEKHECISKSSAAKMKKLIKMYGQILTKNADKETRSRRTLLQTSNSGLYFLKKAKSWFNLSNSTKP